ncbi:MAG: copper resistance protein NlpE N-terminal domain-containing protein [Psychroflexus sp.]
MRSFFSLILIMLMVLTSCKDKPGQQENKEDKALPTADTSRNALDWNGVYKGVLPCADCEGIETQITLHKDLTYVKEQIYLGKTDETFTTSGKFSWNDAGTIIRLDHSKPNAYQVGENILFALDSNDKKITGDLSDLYELTKSPVQNQLFENFWKLTELNGKTIASFEDSQTEAHLIFKIKDSLMVGYGGCNSIRGHYELEGSSNKITLMPNLITLKACEDMTIEDNLLEAFKKVNYYEIENDTLRLLDESKISLLKLLKKQHQN